MSFLKKISSEFQKMPLLFCGLIFLVVFIFLYNSRKGSLFSGMANKKSSPEVTKDRDYHENIGTQHVSPANPEGNNSEPASAAGLKTITSGVSENCLNKATLNPSDLLPNENNQWGSLSPNGEGDLENVSLLKAGHHMGIDTVGGSLRNANLQIRSEPPNPQTQVSPWLNSTITPDLMRVPLELGCGSQ